MGSLLILGAGGYGRVIKETAEAMFCFEKIAFLDDNESKNAIGKCSQYAEFISEFTCAYPAFGTNLLRLQWCEKLKDAGFNIPSFIHPTAYVSPSAKISEGVAVLANATVSAGAVLKTAVIINSGAVADHDCTVCQGAHIAPGAIVKAGATAEQLAKIESGEIVFATH